MTRQRLLAQVGVAFVVGVLGQGCGDSDSEAGDRLVAAGSRVADCLKDVGATAATEPRELSFFVEARDRDDASNTGLVYDRGTGLVVSQWEGTRDANGPPPWVLWEAQEPSDEPIPVEDLAEQPDGYVLFIEAPTGSQLEASERCWRIAAE